MLNLTLSPLLMVFCTIESGGTFLFNKRMGEIMRGLNETYRNTVRKAPVEEVGSRHPNQVLDTICEESCDYDCHCKPCTAKTK